VKRGTYVDIGHAMSDGASSSFRLLRLWISGVSLQPWAMTHVPAPSERFFQDVLLFFPDDRFDGSKRRGVYVLRIEVARLACVSWSLPLLSPVAFQFAIRRRGACPSAL
jgi:hypothetical protein